MTKPQFYSFVYQDPDRPGVCRFGDEVVFTVRMSERQERTLLLFRESEWEPFQQIPLSRAQGVGDLCAVRVAFFGNEKLYYCYQEKNHLFPDPYAEELQCFTQGKKKHWVSPVFPTGQAKTKPLVCRFSDSLFYKLHIRGFSKQRKPAPRHPGTFAGLQDCIPYLQDLGINAVLLMPVYAFTEQEQKNLTYALDGGLEVCARSLDISRHNYWGYTGGWYFAPNPSYSADKASSQEFASLVDALHEAGIACYLEFWFAPEEEGQFVSAVLRHWVRRYQVDGFHLASDGAWRSQVWQDPYLAATCFLIPESMREQMDASPIRSQKRMAVYDTSYRDRIRSFLKGDARYTMEEIAYFQHRNETSFSYVQQITDQNGYTLADLVMYEERHNEANGEDNRDGPPLGDSWNCGIEGPSRKKSVQTLRERQMRNAVLLLLTAQGTPLLYAGDEVLNSQNGNSNAWCQNNETGWVSWNRNAQAVRFCKFIQDAIAFRRAHPVLRQEEPLRLTDYQSHGYPDVSVHGGRAWMLSGGNQKSAFGLLYCGSYARKEKGENDQTLYILYNMYWQEQVLALPEAPQGCSWYEKGNTAWQEGFVPDGKEPRMKEEKEISVPARCIRILIAK